MKILAQLDLSDYMKIATLVNGNASGEPSTYEIEYEVCGYHLFVEVDHEIEYRTDKGDYYTPDYTYIDSQYFDVVKFDCLDGNGDKVDCDFRSQILMGILN